MTRLSCGSSGNLVVGDKFELFALSGVADLNDAQTEKVPGTLVLATYNAEPTDKLREIKAVDGSRVFPFVVQEMTISDSLTGFAHLKATC